MFQLEVMGQWLLMSCHPEIQDSVGGNRSHSQMLPQNLSAAWSTGNKVRNKQPKMQN